MQTTFAAHEATIIIAYLTATAVVDVCVSRRQTWCAITNHAAAGAGAWR